MLFLTDPRSLITISFAFVDRLHHYHQHGDIQMVAMLLCAAQAASRGARTPTRRPPAKSSGCVSLLFAHH